jgi:hypothetical protein
MEGSSLATATYKSPVQDKSMNMIETTMATTSISTVPPESCTTMTVLVIAPKKLS